MYAPNRLFPFFRTKIFSTFCKLFFRLSTVITIVTSIIVCFTFMSNEFVDFTLPTLLLGTILRPRAMFFSIHNTPSYREEREKKILMITELKFPNFEESGMELLSKLGRSQQLLPRLSKLME